MDRFIPQWLENKDVVWWPFATHERLSQQVDGWLDQVRAKARTGVRCPDTQRDLCALMDNMRVVKDRHELDTMRRASAISAGAHIRAMQRSARDLRAGADLREYHLEAELLHAFRDGGSQFPAYTSIVAAGANACVLHYTANSAVLNDGDLLLIDAEFAFNEGGGGRTSGTALAKGGKLVLAGKFCAGLVQICFGDAAVLNFGFQSLSVSIGNRKRPAQLRRAKQRRRDDQ